MTIGLFKKKYENLPCHCLRFFILLCIIASSSCNTSEVITSLQVCNGNLYSITKHNHLDYDVVDRYLTDSVGFNIFLGTIDAEHEVITILCENDSILIINKEMNDDGHYIATKERVFLISDLKKSTLKIKN